jgi:putative Ca2+/H+ antiporter (TMEM165/GDT1 family)
MELGDKTQLSVIALAAEYDAPLTVFIGVKALAFFHLDHVGFPLTQTEKYVFTF